ncbi:hypothetical protein SAMN05421751_1437 [Jhaorihella thermophila]|uniref:Uncharacterized protein n=1 Tax=Jhaorihella thermophila TaxID=488547 RepID=A0A1H5ZJW6_9RHOB|nr:hypothetical protein SAMN05421751_1437 [Jhaorihella thermophila]
MEVMEPRRSMSSVTSSVSVSKRTGTSNAKPAVMETPAAGALSKLTRPVVVSMDQPLACSTPSIATVTLPATGLVMARFQVCVPEA